MLQTDDFLSLCYCYGRKNKFKKIKGSLDYQIQCSSCMLLISTFILKVKPITFHPSFCFDIINVLYILFRIHYNKKDQLTFDSSTLIIILKNVIPNIHIARDIYRYLSHPP